MNWPVWWPLSIHCGTVTPEAALANGSFLDATICPNANQIGPDAFPLIVLGTVFLVAYIASGSMVVPLVLAILVGGAIIATTTSIATQLLVVGFIVGWSVLLWLNWRRMGNP